MSNNDKIEKTDEFLAAEYVLGVLSRDKREAFSRRLEQDSSLRAQVQFWSEQLSPIADDVIPVTPPSTVFSGIEDRLYGEKQATAGWWSSLLLWRGLALASIAALFIGGVYLANLTGGQIKDGQTYVAQISGETGAVQLVAYIDINEGSIRISRTEGIPAEGRDFEIWLIEGGKNPVSLGVLPPGQVAALPVPDQYKTRLSGAVLAVSDEPTGGSPTGQPTGAVLAMGKIVQI